MTNPYLIIPIPFSIAQKIGFLFTSLMVFLQNCTQAQEIEQYVKRYAYTLFSEKVEVVVYEKSNPQQITYFNMHDNENTSVEATKTILSQSAQGKLVELQHSGERLISFEHQGKKYQIDPNRMFTKIGIEKNLKSYGNYSDEVRDSIFAFGMKIYQDFLAKSSIVIAMHNNKNESYHIKSYLSGGDAEQDAEDVYFNTKWGTGEFFYVIDKAHFQYFKKNKASTVLQDNSKVTDDGSLSVFCQRQGLAYINVEAQHGNLQPQIKMLKILQKIITK